MGNPADPESSEPRGSLDEQVAAAVEALRVSELDPDNPDPRSAFVERATAVAQGGWDAFDALLPLLVDADAVRRSAAAQMLGRLGQADRTLGHPVCDSLIAAAADEVDDGVVDALVVAAHTAGLSVEAASNLLLRAPTHRRMGAYHLAMVVSSAADNEPIRRVLRIAADDPDPEVRRWAALGLETAAFD